MSLEEKSSVGVSNVFFLIMKSSWRFASLEAAAKNWAKASAISVGTVRRAASEYNYAGGRPGYIGVFQGANLVPDLSCRCGSGDGGGEFFPRFLFG